MKIKKIEVICDKNFYPDSKYTFIPINDDNNKINFDNNNINDDNIIKILEKKKISIFEIYYLKNRFNI